VVEARPVTVGTDRRRPLLDMFYAGFDLSRKRLDVCVVDRDGAVVAETAVAPDADGSFAWRRGLRRLVVSTPRSSR
jgi:hypothetical protein